MWRTYLLNAAIAAAIGAGTNELAIIAILRYILPRKKSQIARRIRDLVATDLISPDKMRDKMDEPRVADLLRKNIDQALAELLGRDLPSPDALLPDHAADLDAMTSCVRESLLDEFSRRCRDPDFAEQIIRPFLADRWRALKNRTPRSLMSPASADGLVDLARGWAASLEDSETFKATVREALDEWLARRLERAGTMAELLPSVVVASAEELAAAQAPAIIDQLAGVLSDPGVANAITAAIMLAIREQLGNQGVLGNIKGAIVNVMHIERDVHGVTRRLPDTLRENFRRPDNRERFSRALREAVRKILSHRLDPEFKSGATRSGWIDMVMGRLWRHGAFAELGAHAGRMVDEALSRTVGDSVAGLEADTSGGALLDEAVNRCRRILASPATRELLAGQFDELAAEWRRRPLGRLERFVSGETRERIAQAAAEEARAMLRARLVEFAEEAGVWDIVTSSIEGYDNRRLSDLIVQLARSELRWVTVLGGAIGAAVGLLQTFVNQFGLW